MSQLKLQALDKADLEVISGCCQDAVLKIGEMQYFPGDQIFALSFNRFAWEKENTKERHKAVLQISRVHSARVQGIDRKNSDMVISLLAVLFHPDDNGDDENPGGEIELVFAGDGAIRLGVECIEVQLSDLPAAWEASSRPSHD